MDARTARHAIGAIESLLNEGGKRTLNQVEREELAEFCAIVAQGIRGRVIFNFTARQFYDSICASGLIQTGAAIDMDSLIKGANSLNLLLG